MLEISKLLYKQWFIDYNFPNKEGKPYKEYAGKMIESELGYIPKNWSVEKLSDKFNFQEGPGIRNWQYVSSNGTKFINIRCIKDDDLYLDTANMISEEEANGKYSHFMLKEWDVVVSTSGTLGKSQIIRNDHLPLCLNTSVIRFKPLNDFVDFSFMYNYLISSFFLNKLDEMSSGSVQKNFGPTHLKQMKLIYPNHEIMEEFHNIVFPIIEKIQENKKTILNLKKLRDTLLPKLMNGEIDLENIKI